MDGVMKFSARWLIYVFVVLLLFVSIIQNRLLLGMAVFGVMAVCVLVIDWTIGLVFHHARPHAELPSITQLVPTFQTFKSFPSDHTAISVGLACSALLLFGGWIGSLAGVIATLIACARVYVGVHYPRDVVGGLIVGIIVSLASFSFAGYSIVPIITSFL